MASKRMFSRTIVQSAKFVKMPNELRLLYFDLGMSADDDGVVEGEMVLRTNKMKPKSLQTLEELGWIKILNDDLVVYILDWKKNNNIRSDRRTPSIYKDLVNQFFPNEISEKTDKTKKINIDLNIQIHESEE